jgi:hypothetical protein
LNTHEEFIWLSTSEPGEADWSIEHLRLFDGSAESLILATDGAGMPFRLGYEIAWDALWRLRHAHFRVERSSRTDEMSLRSDGAGNWTDSGGNPIPELEGCIDMDLWPTPFTNTFPIRRLGARLGARTALDVAYVQAPALSLSRSRQTYSQSGSHRYRFESADRFTADIEVDADGLVTDYEGLFRRVLRRRIGPT